MELDRKTSASLDLKLCECGCGEQIHALRTDGRPARFKYNHHSRRANHPLWKGGRRKIGGYWEISKPEHRFAQRDGYMREHRVVWEEVNKAILLPWAAVHHINGIKGDNRPENLEAMMKGKHQLLHTLGKKHSADRIAKMRKGLLAYYARGNKSKGRRYPKKRYGDGVIDIKVL